jgi:hypothetical protein
MGFMLGGRLLPRPQTVQALPERNGASAKADAPHPGRAMTHLTTHTAECAPAGSRPVLEGVKEAFGFLPSLQSNVAESTQLPAGSRMLDARFEAQNAFATAAVRDRGHMDDAGIEAFLAAGHARQNLLEVVLGVAAKVMRNHTKHAAKTRLDGFMAGSEWTRPALAAAA